MNPTIQLVRELIDLESLDIVEDVQKPWGKYLTYVRNKDIRELLPAAKDLFRNHPDDYFVTLKHLVLTDELSIQSHDERDEAWYLDSGNAMVYRARAGRSPEEDIMALRQEGFPKEGCIYIPRDTLHTAVRHSREPALIMEISLGTAEEEDIVRYYDKHSASRPEADQKQLLLREYDSGLNVPELQARIRDKKKEASDDSPDPALEGFRL
ncbi:hypothetical protein GF351_03520 [Candidatus Woesearchaeota archaeon]|nr:hypothetical protein [Candidatus Woesearchaeota archaeon]